jgi:serine/threonine-protein kinase
VPLSPTQLAGKFPQLEILELLGHGGMGAVYKARQTNLDRLVALKIIRPEATHEPTFAERFNREAKTLARLSHQHIVAVHDFGEIEYFEAQDPPARLLYYFLMEYVDGSNLRQLMRAAELTPEQALAIVPQVCDALQFAHDEGVVHRDIKPENILLDKRGRVKIADFGLAKLANGSAAEFTLTGTHQVMGTLRYMAPEQMEGSHTVDHRADIYSLGVVFYEMLTGEAPMGHFEPPSKKVQVDVRLDEVVLRSLASKPERRYQHASEVKTDLESISSTFSPQSARSAIDPTGDINLDIEAARQRVQWPGIVLMIVGIFSLILVLMSGSSYYWFAASPGKDSSANEALERTKDVVSTLLPITAALALAIIVGAWKMLRLTSPRWAIAAAVLALLPLPAGPLWLASLPIGIWTLVVLSNPGVQRGFKPQKQRV